MATAYMRHRRLDVQSSIFFSKSRYTTLVDVKIMEHTPIFKLNQLNLLSCCYLFIIMVLSIIEKSQFRSKISYFSPIFLT